MNMISSVLTDKKYPVLDVVTGFINGQPVERNSAAKLLPVIYPATEEQVAQLQESTAEEVDLACRTARQAFEDGPWRSMSVDARKKVFAQIVDVLMAHKDELGYLECLNSGLPMESISERHVPRMCYNFEFFGEVASQAAGQSYTQTQPYLTTVTREPVGVGALIGPWNAPLALTSMKVASCIAFGNTCVVKPSEFTPLALRRFVELLHETDLPTGVVNLVNGRGHVTGDALVAHEDTDVVSFTGGTETAKAIMKTAADGIKPVAFELGGKSANMVFDSTDIDRAVSGSLVGIYSNNGQQCLAGSRILVQKSIADEFIEKFVARSEKLSIGDPMDPDIILGPLANRGHYERVLGYTDIAKTDGAEVLTGGVKASGFERGYFMEPTAVLAPSNSTRVAQDEIFGPFATLLTFEDVDEALAIANDSDFGLVAYIWSDHLPTVMQTSQGVRAGTVWVNTPLTRELRAPFGGYKKSGIGRDSAAECLNFFTEEKTTTIPISQVPLPAWGQ